MEYRKTINLLENTPNQPTYNLNHKIKFKTWKLRSRLCDYSDAYIMVSGSITIIGVGADDAAKRLDERNKGVIFKNCTPFTDCISGISNTQIDNGKYIDVVMPMHNIIECINN